MKARQGVDSLLSRRINSLHQPHPAARRVRKTRRRWGRSSGRATPSLRSVPIGAVSSCLSLTSHLDRRAAREHARPHCLSVPENHRATFECRSSRFARARCLSLGRLGQRGTLGRNCTRRNGSCRISLVVPDVSQNCRDLRVTKSPVEGGHRGSRRRTRRGDRTSPMQNDPH